MEKSSCKIWRGGLARDSGIAFAEDHFDINQDNSFNDQITVEDTGYALGLRMLMGSAFGTQPRDQLLQPQEAAESLWLRFVQKLEQ